MATYDITIDDIPLSTLGYNVELHQGRRSFMGRAEVNIESPGTNGDVVRFGDLISGEYSISVWVADANPATGVRDSGYAPGQWHEQNMDDLLRLVTRRGLLKVQVVMPDGSTRRAMSKVKGSIIPQQSVGLNPVSKFDIVFTIPHVHWESTILFEPQFTIFGQMTTLTDHARGSAPIDDANLKVFGPAVNPTFYVPSGAYCTYPGTIAAGQMLWLDVDNYRAKVGPNNMTGSDQGTSVTPVLNYQGSDTRFLDIEPPYQIRCSASGVTSASKWSVSARTKFF